MSVLHRLAYMVRATTILTNTAANVTLAGPVTTVTRVRLDTSLTFASLLLSVKGTLPVSIVFCSFMCRH